MNLGYVICESELLKINTTTYGWSVADQSMYVEGVTSSVENLSNSRVNNMLNLAKKYGLYIRGSESRIVLDAGCGPGVVTIPARRRGINIIGVDLNPACIKLARYLGSISSDFSEKALSSLFILGNIADLSYRNDCFP